MPFDEYEDDDAYGRVRDSNYHDRRFCNLRCRVNCYNGADDYHHEDPDSLVTCLRQTLPSPFRELEFFPRTGWNYCPSTRNTPGYDRLGQRRLRRRRNKEHIRNEYSEDTSTSNFIPGSSTKMIFPPSWTSIFSSGMNANNIKISNDKSGSHNPKPPTPGGEHNTGTDIKSNNSNKNDKNEDNSDHDEIHPSDQKRLKLSNDDATVVTISTAGESSSCTVNSSKKNESTASSMSSLSSGAHIEKQQGKQQTHKDKPSTKIGSLPPKASLYQWYGKKPRKIQLKAAEQYVTWDNGRMSHEQLFTSVFICPITKEAFLAGPWSGNGEVATEGVAKASDSGNRNKNSKTSFIALPDEDGIYWYPRKTMAEHAVAARACDCLLMREGINIDDGRMGGLVPYWPSQRPTWPLNRIPNRILECLPLYQQKTNDSLLSSNDSLIKGKVSSAIPTTFENKNSIFSGKREKDDKTKQTDAHSASTAEGIINKRKVRGRSHDQIRRKVSKKKIDRKDNNSVKPRQQRETKKCRAQRIASGRQEHQFQHRQQAFRGNIRSTREQPQSVSTTQYFNNQQTQYQNQHSSFFQQQYQQYQHRSEPSNNNFQHVGGIHNIHYLPQQQKSTPPPPPPPPQHQNLAPPPPPPLTPIRHHINYPLDFSNQHQHHHLHGSFENNQNNNNNINPYL